MRVPHHQVAGQSALVPDAEVGNVSEVFANLCPLGITVPSSSKVMDSVRDADVASEVHRAL